MIHIGSRVRVGKELADSFKPKGWTGREGVVTALVTRDNGASESDPMCIVRTVVDNEAKIDGFWTEELEVLP